MSAHKATLCQWPYFRVALLGDFKEAEDQCIELPEDYPETVQAFLEFIYSGNYVFYPSHDKRILKCSKRKDESTDVCPCEKFVMCGTPAMKSTSPNFDECLICEHTIDDHHVEGSESSNMTVEQDLEKMEFHARVYFLADKFDISKLRKLAVDRIYDSKQTPNGENGINELKVAKLIYLNTSPKDKLRRAALEKTVDLLLTTNSVTPSPVQAKEGFVKSASPFAQVATSPFSQASQSTGSPFGQVAGHSPFGQPAVTPFGVFGSRSSSAFGQSGGFGSGSPPSAFGSLRAPSGEGDGGNKAPIIRDSEANKLLEELVAEDPSFAVDIIKCLARNGVPLTKYY